mmetsp:Transcript_19866/g.39611  ORF Transcript_19866/g.39611 Transcript_19866/m.39611 type:complete len:273 (+) Transcript_19866:9-827(+)
MTNKTKNYEPGLFAKSKLSFRKITAKSLRHFFRCTVLTSNAQYGSSPLFAVPRDGPPRSVFRGFLSTKNATFGESLSSIISKPIPYPPAALPFPVSMSLQVARSIPLLRSRHASGSARNASPPSRSTLYIRHSISPLSCALGTQFTTILQTTTSYRGETKESVRKSARSIPGAWARRSIARTERRRDGSRDEERRSVLMAPTSRRSTFLRLPAAMMPRPTIHQLRSSPSPSIPPCVHFSILSLVDKRARTHLRLVLYRPDTPAAVLKAEASW